MTGSHSSGVMLTIIRSRRMPAALIKTSSRPKESIAVSTIRLASSKSDTSAKLATADPPAAVMASTVATVGPSLARLPSTSTPGTFTTTFAPQPARSLATEAPIPRPAPVTTMTRWSSRPMMSFPRLLIVLPSGGGPTEKGSGAQPAAATDRHQRQFLVRFFETVDCLGDEPGAGSTQRVAERDGAAVRVHPVHVWFELSLPGEDDWCEGLVDLEQIDVCDRQGVAGEQFAGRRDGTGQHEDRVTSHEELIDDRCLGPQAGAGGRLGRGNQNGRRPVADLGRRARCDNSIGAVDRVQRGEPVQCGGPKPFVTREVSIGRAGTQQMRRDRSDLSVEASCGPGVGRSLLRAESEFVAVSPGDAPPGGDSLSSLELQRELAVARVVAGRYRLGQSGEVR